MGANERRRALDLEAAHREWRGMFERAAVGLAQVGLDGRWLRVNRRLCETLGYSESELVGRTFQEVTESADLEADLTHVGRLLAGEADTFSMEKRYVRKDGSRVWANLTVSLVRREGGEPDYFISVVEDITGRRRVAESLREAKEAAEEANRAKDRFLAVLSHELRTPLSPVLLAVTAMERDETLSDELRGELAMVRRNVELEARLIDDLLDLSRVANGKLRIERRAVGVNQMMRHALETCEGEMREKGLRLSVGLGAGPDVVMGDAARLQQVFWNLVSNAIKFTPAGGEVAVASEVAGTAIRVSVRDNGVGIPAEAVGRIFDAFEQVEMRVARGGLGLGLAICKGVVVAHGGTIRAESEGVGRGARLVVELPLAAMVVRPEVARPAEGAGRMLRVLLVEDHLDTARVLARLMKLKGHEVRVAHDVAGGLALAAGGEIDLVVSDVGLPDGTGYELMAALRERYGLVGIAMTGYGMEEDVRRGKESGFAEYLVKPVNVAMLEQAIRRVGGRA